jgi:hypothetical protein
VLDKKMVLAGRSRDAQRFVGKLATPSLANRVAASTSGMFTALNQEGNSVYTVFSRSSKTGWTIVIGVPAAEVEGPIQRVLALLGIAGCVLIALTWVWPLWSDEGLCGCAMTMSRRCSPVSLERGTH